MRRLLTTLAIGFLIHLVPTPASATTPGRVCRQACKPRVLEQCDGLVGAERRRCRRPLVRACKATTPQIGCPTTGDLQQELADRRFRIEEPTDRSITLCADGDFSLTDRGEPDAVVSVIERREGSWSVRLVDGVLALVLDDDAPIPLGHDTTGTLLVDGRTTALADAQALCSPLPPPPPAVDDVDQARLVALVRALADRTIVIDAPDGDPAQQRELRLCSSGKSTDTTSDDAGTVESAVDGTWTIDGSILQLSERAGSTVPFGLELRDDGTLLVDDEVARLRDARVECADADLQARLIDALGGTAWFLVQQSGNIPVRLKLGLCDSGRFRLESTSSSVGSWSVHVANGIATLTLARDGGGTRTFEVAFDPNGAPTVDGTAPIDDTGLASAACQS